MILEHSTNLNLFNVFNFPLSQNNKLIISTFEINNQKFIKNKFPKNC